MGSCPTILKLLRKQNHVRETLYRLSPVPYKGDNPYSYCPSCEKSMIEVSISGHNKGCRVNSLESDRASLTEMIYFELHRFLEKKEHLNPRYINYLWFKRDSHFKEVSQLEELIKFNQNQEKRN